MRKYHIIRKKNSLKTEITGYDSTTNVNIYKAKEENCEVNLHSPIHNPSISLPRTRAEVEHKPAVKGVHHQVVEIEFLYGITVFLFQYNNTRNDIYYPF
jgi:hypothetical protein